MTSTIPWSIQLEQISKDLMDATTNIQSSFKTYAYATQTQAKCDTTATTTATTTSALLALHPEADPVNILSRISSLKSTLERLKSECLEYVEQRPFLAEEVTGLLLDNFLAIEELTLLTKGKKASIDPNLKHLAICAHEQNTAWKKSNQQCHDQTNSYDLDANAKDGNSEYTRTRNMDSTSSFHSTTTDSEHEDENNTKRNSSSFISISNGIGTIKITQEEFNDIPPQERGRCSLSHVQTIASFICTETIDRYHEGYRGKNLAMVREHCLKYSGGYPGLSQVIRNHVLWRDILNCLRFLGIVRVDSSDGSFFLTGI